MRKTILQVYILRCDAEGTLPSVWQKKVFDLMLCENIPVVQSHFMKAWGRMPISGELIEDAPLHVLRMLEDLPETIENVCMAATEKTMKRLAAAAIESPLTIIPLQIAPYRYVHLQWGNARCPGKWFMQRWNATNIE